MLEEAKGLLSTVAPPEPRDSHEWPRQDEESRAQRAARGWADADVWALDTYLASILCGALRYMADNTVTSPPTLSHPEWRDLLEEMAEGFGAWAETDEFVYEDRPVKHVHHSLKLLRQWWVHLWD